MRLTCWFKGHRLVRTHRFQNHPDARIPIFVLRCERCPKERLESVDEAAWNMAERKMKWRR